MIITTTPVAEGRPVQRSLGIAALEKQSSAQTS